MENETVTKGAIASLMLVLGFIYESVGVFFFVLVLAMLVDYITGIAAAWVEGSISSKRGAVGVIRKLGYGAAVLIAWLLDLALIYAVEQFGFDMPVKSIFGVLTIGWLFANEGISIIENLGRMGVNIPPFLKKGFHTFKDTIEQKGDNDE